MEQAEIRRTEEAIREIIAMSKTGETIKYIKEVVVKGRSKKLIRIATERILDDINATSAELQACREILSFLDELQSIVEDIETMPARASEIKERFRELYRNILEKSITCINTNAATEPSRIAEIRSVEDIELLLGYVSRTFDSSEFAIKSLCNVVDSYHTNVADIDNNRLCASTILRAMNKIDRELVVLLEAVEMWLKLGITIDVRMQIVSIQSMTQFLHGYNHIIMA